jgi:hypothetical protein
MIDLASNQGCIGAISSDDYAFCRRVRDTGFRIWLTPRVRLSHSGPAIYSGSIADLVPLFANQLSASPE